MSERDAQILWNRIRTVRAHQVRLRFSFYFLLALWAVTFVNVVSRRGASVHAQGAERNSILRVRQVAVVDGSGYDRLRIGAPHVQPPLFGKRLKRLDSLAGFLLFDADGTERSGISTGTSSASAIFLSLDTVGDEAADLSAEGSGDAAIYMHDGQDQLQIGVAESGPVLKLTRGEKAVFAAQESTLKK